MKKIESVSIVIPVYNEQDQLADCLTAIAAQTARPLEVIVVDNNSTDDTIAITRRFDFVKLASELRQGVAFARDRGFDEARGDIIGRIDADTVLPTDWVETIQNIFEDSNVDAVSGSLSYRHVGLKPVFDGLDQLIRNFLARRMGKIGEQFLYGGNMAIRAEAWRAVRDQVCHEHYFHEDLDLAVHLTKLGRSAVFAPAMRASIAPRQADSGPRSFWHYVWSNPKVYARHGLRSQRIIYPVALLILALYWPMRLMYRGYDPERQKFSIVYAFKAAPVPRISPLAERVAKAVGGL